MEIWEIKRILVKKIMQQTNRQGEKMEKELESESLTLFENIRRRFQIFLRKRKVRIDFHCSVKFFLI